MRRLGKTELKVSTVGFGSGPVGYLGESVERTAQVLNLLLDEGVNLIDTAACYPDSEPLIARSVGHRRGEYILVTKCGHRVEGIDSPEWSPELIRQSVDRSLRLLQTDHIDVMLLHTCSRDVLEREEVLATLVESREAGKIGFIGYSGDNEAAAFAAGLPDVAVLETSVNLCDQANIDTVLPVAASHDVGVLAKRPLANAAWRSGEQQRGIYRGYAETYSRRLSCMKLEPSALGFPGDRHREFARLALRFTLGVPGVDSVIAGTTNPENARINLQNAAEGPLDREIQEALQQAFEKARSADSEDWPGLG